MHHEYIRTISTAVLAILAVGGATVAANEYLDAREQDLNARIADLNARIVRVEADVAELKETATFNAEILKALAEKFQIATDL